ncbi:hypothetical protein D3227_31900 [Mesorhizobium waimense]|uniref:Uncharacterized protein n=1 Tax=Mesorhizobium waimense TaxID=1300307 RepID=A0A3A5K3X1_9HYPH|nr:hypothetical protein [Mesorhizobium waimense]RJT29458.1 hypothetical protein D3227_31900 [Mesorhizobium waimense]
MAKAHNRQRAQTFLNLIEQTKGKADVEFCFAVGTIGDPEEKAVVLVKKSGLNSLVGVLKKMPYEIGEDGKADGFALLQRGTGKMNEDGVILLRLARGGKAGFQQVKRRMKEYFRGFGLRLPDMEEAGVLTEEDVRLFEGTAMTNSQYLPADGDEQPTNTVKNAEDTLSERVENGEGIDRSEAEGHSQRPLSDVLKQGVASAAATISNHVLSLSEQIGAGQTAELARLTKKVTDWLGPMLAATPSDEQEAKLHNSTSRLMLMLACPENLRNLQYVDETADGVVQDETHGSGPEEIAVNGIDLNRVPTNTLKQDEVIETLFRLAKAKAQERQLSFALAEANSEKIAMIVSSQWPKEEGDAARRREIVERLIAVVEQRLGNDDHLVDLLGVKVTDQQKGKKVIVNLVENIKDTWEACLGTALTLRDDVKIRINRLIDVETRGGSWRRVDDIFLQFNGELSDQLTAMMEEEGEAMPSAIERLEATVHSMLSYLDSNATVALLDNPPMDLGPGTIGQTLRAGLADIINGLKRIKSSHATFAP